MSYLGSQPPVQLNHGYGAKKKQKLPPLPSGFRVPNTSSLDDVLPTAVEVQETGGLPAGPAKRDPWERKPSQEKPIGGGGGHPDPWQRVAQLEKALQFVKEQQAMMLQSLHQEVDTLKQKNRDLLMQVVVKEQAGNASNIHDTQSMEIATLDKQVDDLKKALREEQNKNVSLNNVVEEYKRREKEVASSHAANRESRKSLPSATSYSTRNLTEAQQTINGLRLQLQQLQASVASRLHPQALKSVSIDSQRNGTSSTEVLRRSVESTGARQRKNDSNHLPKIPQPQRSLRKTPSVPSSNTRSSEKSSNLPSIPGTRPQVSRSNTPSPDIPTADSLPGSPQRAKGRTRTSSKPRTRNSRQN